MQNTKLNLTKIEESISAKLPNVDSRLTKGNITWFLFCSLFTFAMIAGGRNFFPLIGAVLVAVSGLLSLLFVLKNNRIPFYLLLSACIVTIGLYLFFMIYGAEDFGHILWWNLIFVAPIIATIAVMIFVTFKPNIQKIVASFLCVFLAGSAVTYFLFMSLRLRPSVKRMYEGEKAYLDSLKNKQTENAPNVLIILMDDMAYADLSCYSTDTALNTPNIDEIANNGIYMENFYASAPVCTPSRFSTLTGRYATRGYLDNVIFPTVVDNGTFSPTHFINPYQFLNNVDGILGDEITIAEALQALDYDTACIGKWNLGDYGEYLPTNQGFDYFYGSYYVNDMTPYNWVEERNGVSTEVRSHDDNLDQSESTGVFTKKLQETFANSVEQGNKFFGFYATPWPHYPIYSNDNGNGIGDTTDDSYIACIEEFDKSLGELFTYMKSTADPSGNGSVYDNTLIIFTSDNGPGREGSAGALRGRKNTTFEGGMKVPMLASYPNGGLGAGSTVPSTTFTTTNHDGTTETFTTKKITSGTMLTDLFPTILDYATGSNSNLPTDRIIDGVSLRNLWSGDIASNTTMHDELYYMKKGSVQSVRVESDGVAYKYFENVATENSAFIDQRYKNYLFNLTTDPSESYNISMEQPELAEELKSKLQEFRKSLKENRRGIIE